VMLKNKYISSASPPLPHYETKLILWHLHNS